MNEKDEALTPRAKESTITVGLESFGRLCMDAAKVPQLASDLAFAAEGLRQAGMDQEKLARRLRHAEEMIQLHSGAAEALRAENAELKRNLNSARRKRKAAT